MQKKKSNKDNAIFLLFFKYSMQLWTIANQNIRDP